MIGKFFELQVAQSILHITYLQISIAIYLHKTYLRIYNLQVAQEILHAVRRCELPLQLDSLTEADGNCFCRCCCLNSSFNNLFNVLMFYSFPPS